LNSLNAGVSCRKCRGRANLGEQIHKMVFGVDRNSGAEFSGIVGGETLIGANFHSCQQRLRIQRLNARRLQLRGLP
jgi:hypothetical protein